MTATISTLVDIGAAVTGLTARCARWTMITTTVADWCADAVEAAELVASYMTDPHPSCVDAAAGQDLVVVVQLWPDNPRQHPSTVLHYDEAGALLEACRMVGVMA